MWWRCTPSDKKLRVLVIGCGSIGRRHIRLLQKMGVEVEGADPLACQMDAPELKGIRVYEDYKDATATTQYDGAIIATPNHLHHDPAFWMLQKTDVVFIEKPLAYPTVKARNICEYEKILNCSVLVGYCLRYHPGLLRVKQLLDEGAIGTVRYADIWCASYLPDWRPGTDYRQGYAARRETGGGVLLDCSHEIDYACWLFGEPESVSCMTANTGALGIETEELADLTIWFKSGMLAHLHLSYLDRLSHRGCRIVGDRATVLWDFGYDFVWQRLCGAQANAVVPDDLYRAELSHFLQVVRGEAKPLVTGEDGLRALRIVAAAKQSSEEGRVIHF